MGNGKLGLALGHGLGGLGSGLIGNQLQLVAGAHLTEQRGSQEGLGAHGAVDGHADLLALGHIGLQVGNGLDVQTGLSGENKDGGIQILHKNKVVLAELQLGGVDDGGNRQ